MSEIIVSFSSCATAGRRRDPSISSRIPMGAAPGLAPGSGGVWAHRGLVLARVRREFSGRYQGAFGGIAWSCAQPLFLLAVYTVAFGVILQARWGFAGGTADYALMMCAGLIVFNAFAECLQKAPSLVAGNP